MEEGAECDADEFAKFGLDCCLMLHDDDHDAEEVEGVVSGPLLRLLAWEQSNASVVTNEEEEGREEEGEEEGEEGGGGVGGGVSLGTGQTGCRRWERCGSKGGSQLEEF
jgi:hypothetical protein